MTPGVPPHDGCVRGADAAPRTRGHAAPASATASARVAVVGSINVDEIAAVRRHPLPGETLLATSSAVAPGGKGANQAVAAARLGASVCMVGAVGDDERAKVAVSLLLEAGVDLSAVVHAHVSTGIARITVDAAGENTIIVIPGANAEVDAAFVTKHEELIASAAVVVLQGEIPAAGTARAAACATGRVLVNLAPVIEIPAATLHAADPLVVNEHEARLLLSSLAGASNQVSATDEDAARRLHAHGIRSVVLTRGEFGVVCVDDDGAAVIPSPHVTAIDTSGAGDAFVGALAARLASGDDLRAAARFAVRVGAFAVQASGTQPSFPWAGDELPASDEGGQR